MKPCCILIAGMPAAGKSTFAARLTRELGIPCLSKDLIKEALFDTLGFRSREEKVRLGDAAYRIQLDLARPQLLAGQSIALENNFEDASIPLLTQLLEETDSRPVTVMLDGDIAAIHRCFLERDQSALRHRGHVVNTRYPETEPAPYSPLSLDTFAAGMEKRGFRRFDVGGPRLTVDATDPANVDWKGVVDWVRSQTHAPETFF